MGRKRVVYYVDAGGDSPILEDIHKLTLEEQQKIFAYISLLEEKGEELRRPMADYVGDKIYELRPRAHRVLYFFMLKEYAVVVHLFRKRTDRLPEREKRVALTHMQDFLRRYRQGEVSLGGELL
ncbi:MAG: type II toxin-antitoxin system RelE/ParE family toxin [Candidatus Omnitrophica bacterium]|nr:type II toxin-antitoxin system RelE/ParE family toxin [Candidatus Omnitrophota bacterium]